MEITEPKFKERDDTRFVPELVDDWWLRMNKSILEVAAKSKTSLGELTLMGLCADVEGRPYRMN